MLALQAVTPAQLHAAVPEVTLAEARKLVAQVHRGEPVAPTSSIRRVAAAAVRAVGAIPSLTIVDEVASQLDPFVKYALESGGERRVRGAELVEEPAERAARVAVLVRDVRNALHSFFGKKKR